MGKRKSISERFADGQIDSSSRVEQVATAAIEKEQQEQQAVAAVENAEALSKLDGRKKKLNVEFEKIKVKNEPFDKISTMNLNSNLASALNMARADYGMTNQKLLAIAVSRLLDDLKKDSKVLQAYLG